jgi:hypothetical protein
MLKNKLDFLTRRLLRQIVVCSALEEKRDESSTAVDLRRVVAQGVRVATSSWPAFYGRRLLPRAVALCPISYQVSLSRRAHK